jgi:hypothetical protein
VVTEPPPFAGPGFVPDGVEPDGRLVGTVVGVVPVGPGDGVEGGLLVRLGAAVGLGRVPCDVRRSE